MKLCSVLTQRVNEIRSRIEILVTPSMNRSVQVYVDDILGIGDRLTVEKVIEITRIMEEKKKCKFSKKKPYAIKSEKEREGE